jgi:hypothetical protein
MQLAQPPATLNTRSGYKVSTPTGTDDVVIQLNNVEVLRIKLGTNMTIKALGSLSIEAQNITLKADMNVSIRSGGNLDLKSDGGMNLKSSAPMSVTGSSVNVNNGALEVT